MSISIPTVLIKISVLMDSAFGTLQLVGGKKYAN